MVVVLIVVWIYENLPLFIDYISYWAASIGVHATDFTMLRNHYLLPKAGKCLKPGILELHKPALLTRNAFRGSL